MSYLETPLIYNLFPLLVGPADRWVDHAERAASLGFNWLYLNPIHYPGFSGSLYAIKDYDRLHPAFVPAGSDSDALDTIAPILSHMSQAGIHPVVDLVINHTARDSPLVAEHPDWYARDEHGNVRSPYAVDPDDPRKITVWGDLAEIDNKHSPDRARLWQFWANLVERYLSIGFEGFRCDAAYKVPAELWRHLAQVATRVNPSARFFAETLGCTLDQAQALRASGLHVFFNSSKWWDFEASWCLEQHQAFEDVPSISFPETHDTARLAAESGANQAVQRQRYAFAATFSTGLMMPIGYEFGFRKKLDVVHTSPSDWEVTLFDLQAFITSVNRLKLETPLLQGESHLRRLDARSADVLVIERRSDRAPGEIGWIVVNKRPRDFLTVSPSVFLGDRAQPSLIRLCSDDLPKRTEPVPNELALSPAEVLLLTASES